MVQAESNVIKKWRFCWLHPPRELLVVSSWQISNDRQLPPPHHEIIILSRGDIGKRMPPPHHEKIILSRRDKFQMKKNYLHPTTRKLFCLVVTNFKWKKNYLHPTTRKLFCLVVTNLGWKKKLPPPHHEIISLSRRDLTQSHKKATTDNPLLKRVAMAICCRVLHSATCWHVQMSAADLQRAKWSPFPLYPVVSQAWWP